ncbi:hypothetical protein RND81_08G227500 [Saponaria officinalis]|uniref:RING-type E3 ubiquitin transferase n=1 Tax=Saponaria officinalis TaxID=3572 RepID=A0AAW1JBC1_SAPOF
MSETLAAIMGAICSCLHVEDLEDYVNRNSFVYRNCVCVSCFLQNFFHMYSSLFQRGEVQAIHSSIQGSSLNSTASTDNSLADMYRPPPRPLPYDADPRFYRLQRDGLFSRREKGSSHAHDESEPPRRNEIDDESELLTTGEKWNESTCEDGSKENRKSSAKLSSTKATAVMGYFYSSSEDEDVCPTCLEEYTEENPKIVTKCSHHFHLGCIYEWMERSENCPVCGKVMAFDESP